MARSSLADKLGRICLDILKGLCIRLTADKWSPALQVRTVLLSIQALLSAPNPDDPLANDVAEHYKTNEKAYVYAPYTVPLRPAVSGRRSMPCRSKNDRVICHQYGKSIDTILAAALAS